jgi:predicted dehydrogenase
MQYLKVGLIGGLGKQGEKLVTLLRNNCPLNIKPDFLYYLHRGYDVNMKNKTVSFIDGLFLCDVIIIASPNNTHIDYIKYLYEHYYSGYIFCEKPIANSLEDLNYLNKLPGIFREKILFGFNLRYGDCLPSNLKMKDLGNLVYISVVDGHGLAYKQEYKNSWRNNPKNNTNGIIGNVLLHYLDMFNYFFGTPMNTNIWGEKQSPFSQVFDTVHYSGNYQNGCLFADVFLSYSTPCISYIKAIFDNGIIEYGDEIVIRYPRETCNSNGNFISPDIKKIIKKDINEIWTESQINMIKYFINLIIMKDKIDLKQFLDSLKSTEFLLKHLENYAP